MALTGFGVWALVAQTLSFQIVATALAFGASRWAPSLIFSWTAFREMVRFGVKVIGTDAVSMGRVWLENVIVAAVLGVAGLGYLSIAQRLVQIAHDLTTSALVPVSLVVFSRIRESVDRVRAGYIRAQSASYALVTPAMLLIVVAAPWLVPLLFGDQWGVSILPAQIYAVAGILTMSGLDQGLFFGLGRPGAWFVYILIVDVVTVLVTIALAPIGLKAIALGFLGVAFLATAARWFLVGHRLHAPWWWVAAPLARVCVPTVCAAGVAIVVAGLLQNLPAFIVVSSVGVAILAVYVPIARLMLPDTWTEVLQLAKAVLRRRPAPSGVSEASE